MPGTFSNRGNTEQDTDQLGILMGIQTCSPKAKGNTKGAHDPKLKLKGLCGPSSQRSWHRVLLPGHLGPGNFFLWCYSQVPSWDLSVTQGPGPNFPLLAHRISHRELKLKVPLHQKTQHTQRPARP